jgi:hypothetical protein
MLSHKWILSFPVTAILGAGAVWAPNLSGQDLPGMAASVIQQSELARQAVTARDSAAAVDHIRQATALADEILKATPQQPQPVLVRVDKEVDTSTTYAPVKGNKSGEFSENRLKNNTWVQDAQENITISKLDVTSAAMRLQAAQNAIGREDWVTADSQLAAIPASVIRTNVEGNLPLLEARQNLRLARMRVQEEKFKDARLPLLAAARDLADYEKLSPGPRAQEAESLRQQIDAYSRTVRHDHTNAVNQIDAWLSPIDKWNGELAE